jgi:hypothetical protein
MNLHLKILIHVYGILIRYMKLKFYIRFLIGNVFGLISTLLHSYIGFLKNLAFVQINLFFFPITESHPQEQYKTREYRCTYFRSKFEHKDYNFGPDDNVTFFVYVYGFKTPFWLQVCSLCFASLFCLVIGVLLGHCNVKKVISLGF